MGDDTSQPDARDWSLLPRRRYLRAAGAGTGYALVGTLGHGRLRSGAPEPDHGSAAREDFLWVHRDLWREARFRETLFAFARRHDLAVVLPSAPGALDALEATVGAAAARDLDVWLRVGIPTSVTVREFAADPDARDRHLARLRRTVRVHADAVDTGQVILWEEAPVMGRWTASGEWNRVAVQRMLDHGPALFEAQKRAVEAVNPALDVGIFVHFPYIVDSKRPDVFPTLVDRLRSRGAVPDFAFTDFYRGWYEKDVGPGPADAAVRSLVTNAREALDGRDVFYLGQSHTINPNHTPSKQALRMNLQASLAAGADGLGWYARLNYVPTRQGFDPFVPNAPDASFDSGPVTTATVARDRFLYAWLATLDSRAGFDPAERFDLWLHGEGLGVHEHRLSVRTADGWQYVGHLGGYLDGRYPYGDTDTTVFRALGRDHIQEDQEDERLDLRIETVPGSDGAVVRTTAAMPCDPDAYVSEPEADRLLAGEADLGEVALGTTDEPVRLPPGETRRVTLPISGAGTSSLAGLKYPTWVDAHERLAAFDARADVDHRSRFDLWVRGTGLADPSTVPSLLNRDGEPRPPVEAAAVATSGDRVAVFHGLDRDRFRPATGLAFADDGSARVDTYYAMPYAGPAAFRPPPSVADLLANQPGEVETFSIVAAER